MALTYQEVATVPSTSNTPDIAVNKSNGDIYVNWGRTVSTAVYKYSGGSWNTIVDGVLTGTNIRNSDLIRGITLDSSGNPMLFSVSGGIKRWSITSSGGLSLEATLSVRGDNPTPNAPTYFSTVTRVPGTSDFIFANDDGYFKYSGGTWSSYTMPPAIAAITGSNTTTRRKIGSTTSRIAAFDDRSTALNFYFTQNINTPTWGPGRSISALPNVGRLKTIFAFDFDGDGNAITHDGVDKIYKISGIPIGPPAAPTLSATTTNDRVIWTWNSVTDATSYEFELNSGTPVGNTTTSRTTFGLTAGTTQTARVRTRRGNEVGPWSSPLSVIVGFNPPTNLRVTGRTGSTITWSWNAVAAATNGYEVEIDGSTVSASTNTYTASSLPFSTTKSIRVRSVRGSNRTDWTTAVSGTTLTKPLTPQNLQLDGVTHTTITWSWDAVSDSTGYEIQIGSGAAVPVSTTTYTLENLNHSVTRSARVRAVRGNDRGDLSSSVSGTTTFLPPPNNLRLDSVVSNRISWLWDSVPDVTGYDVETLGVTYPETSTGYKLEPLPPLTTRSIRVRSSVSPSAKSTWTSTVSGTTEAAQIAPKEAPCPPGIELPVNPAPVGDTIKAEIIQNDGVDRVLRLTAIADEGSETFRLTASAAPSTSTFTHTLRAMIREVAGTPSTPGTPPKPGASAGVSRPKITGLPDRLSITKGESETINYSVSPSDSIVRVTSSKSNIVSVQKVTDIGENRSLKVTAGQTLGNSTITVVATRDGKSSLETIPVFLEGAPFIYSLPKKSSVPSGRSVRIRFGVTGTGNVAVSVSSSDGAIRAALTSSSKGNNTLTLTGLRGGSANVTITAKNESGTSTHTLQVTSRATPTLIGVATSVTLNTGETHEDPFTVTDPNATVRATATGGVTASVVGSGENRILRVTAGPNTGSATITVTATNGAGNQRKTQRVTINSVSRPPEIYDLESTATVKVGKFVGDFFRTSDPNARISVTQNNANVSYKAVQDTRRESLRTFWVLRYDGVSVGTTVFTVTATSAAGSSRKTVTVTCTGAF